MASGASKNCGRQEKPQAGQLFGVFMFISREPQEMVSVSDSTWPRPTVSVRVRVAHRAGAPPVCCTSTMAVYPAAPGRGLKSTARARVILILRDLEEVRKSLGVAKGLELRGGMAIRLRLVLPVATSVQ